MWRRRFGARCGGCEQEIGPSELVRRARLRVYHLKCFTCVLCRKQLSTGEELYMLDENRFICKDDYLAKFQGTRAAGTGIVQEGTRLCGWLGSRRGWLACWTQAQKGLGSNRSRDAVG